MLTRKQLQNDLDAARRKIEIHRDTELRLAGQINTMRVDHASQSNELVKAYRDRDDWKEAFKLIMKLVK